MNRKVSTHLQNVLLTAGIALGLLGLAQAATNSNIDPTHKYAWSTNVGWINFRPTHGGVIVYSDHLEGYAWGENIGWIRLGTHTGGGTHTYTNNTSADYGVNVNGSGDLSGYAWSTNAGWINFNPTHGGVTIDPASGDFDGYAWGENIGWIHFKNTSLPYGVSVVESNQAPFTPSNPIPADGANDVPASQILSWEGGDPDGDPVTYTVALGTSDPPPLVATDVTATSYNPGTLNTGTAYYWRITATDGMSTTVGPTWSFTTGGITPPNQAPYTPSDPIPPDGADDVPASQILSWEGGDPDGDPVTYTVAFGTNPAPSVVATDVITTSYSPGLLDTGTTYYWAVTATDGLSVTVGPVWSFTTTLAPPVETGYEPNDTCAQAYPIPTDGTVQIHTFQDQNDVDWVSFEAISGTTYLIEATTPADSIADVILALYDACTGGASDVQNHTFSPDVRLRYVAPQDGTMYLKLSNYFLDTHGPLASYHLSVRALGDTATPGALVLVAGRLKDRDPVQVNIYEVTNAVYRLFRSHGYTSDRIYYLAPEDQDADGDGKNDVIAQPANVDLEYAITQWAQDKVGADRAFTLYLMDHGGTDVFYLNGAGQTLSPEDLNTWLDTLEAAAPGVRINVIIEACHSGSFLDSLGRSGRVVMASTGTWAVAYASQGGGAAFSDAFLDALDRGRSLYGAFEEADWVIQEVHADQTPWLDDDGDGVPYGVHDGEEAARRGFAYAGTLDPAEEKWPPYVVWAEVELVEGSGDIIRAEVRDDTGVLSVWAVVYKPSYQPPNPDETEELVEEVLPTVTLLDPDRNGIFQASTPVFDESGTYRVVIYAVDIEGLEGRPKTVRTGWQVYLPLVLRSN